MGSKADNARKAKDSRAMLDAATNLAKLPKKPLFAAGKGDVVRFCDAVDADFRLHTPIGESKPVQMTWTVARLSGDDVPGGAVHVVRDAVKGASGALSLPQPRGRVIHFAARANSLVLVKSAGTKAPANTTGTAG